MEPAKPAVDAYPRVVVAVLSLLGGLLIAFLARAAWESSYAATYISALGILSVTSVETLFVAGEIALIASAPLLGLAADLLGRRKVLLAGATLLGATMVACGLARQPLLVCAIRLGMAFGLAMLLPPLVAFLLDATPSPWTLGSVAGAYLASGTVATAIVTRLSQPPGNLPWILISSLSGQLLLCSVCIGGGLIAAAYVLSRQGGRTAKSFRVESGGLRAAESVLLLLMGALVAFADFVSGSFPFVAAQPLGIAAETIVGWHMLCLGIRALAQLLGGLGADLADWFTRRHVRRPLGRLVFLLLGPLLFLVAIGLARAPASQAALLGSMAAGACGLGLVVPQIIALGAANVRPRWWSSAFGLYVALTGLPAILINAPWRLLGGLLDGAGAGIVALVAAALAVGLAGLVAAVCLVSGPRGSPVQPRGSEPGLDVS